MREIRPVDVVVIGSDVEKTHFAACREPNSKRVAEGAVITVAEIGWVEDSLEAVFTHDLRIAKS